MARKKSSKKEVKKSISELENSLKDNFNYEINHDFILEEYFEKSRKLLSLAKKAILEKEEDLAKMHLKNYSRQIEIDSTSFGIKNNNLENDYFFMRDIFRDLRKVGYFVSNGKKQISEKRAYE